MQPSVTNLLERVVICRVPKEESAYFYHTLELQQGLGAYHTLHTEPRFCDVRVFVPVSLWHYFLEYLALLKSESSLSWWEIEISSVESF